MNEGKQDWQVENSTPATANTECVDSVATGATTITAGSPDATVAASNAPQGASGNTETTWNNKEWTPFHKFGENDMWGLTVDGNRVVALVSVGSGLYSTLQYGRMFSEAYHEIARLGGFDAFVQGYYDAKQSKAA